MPGPAFWFYKVLFLTFVRKSPLKAETKLQAWSVISRALLRVKGGESSEGRLFFVRGGGGVLLLRLRKKGFSGDRAGPF